MGRPFWAKAAVCHRTPTLDFVFDGPLPSRTTLIGLPERYVVVATSLRLADQIAQSSPAELARSCPISRFRVIPSREANGARRRRSPSCKGRARRLDAVLRCDARRRTLESIAELVAALPKDVGLLVAGDPLADGVSLVDSVKASRKDHPHLAVIARRVSDNELAAVLSAHPVVLIADHIGVLSVSGVLIDALRCWLPSNRTV